MYINIFSREKVNYQLNGESSFLLNVEAKNEASRSVEISSTQYSHLH